MKVIGEIKRQTGTGKRQRGYNIMEQAATGEGNRTHRNEKNIS